MHQRTTGNINELACGYGPTENYYAPLTFAAIFLCSLIGLNPQPVTLFFRAQKVLCETLSCKLLTASISLRCPAQTLKTSSN